ncbi:retrovirus-related pol polyprotein from transposon TNT 1-94 [Tanacetum coccineum]
MDSEKYLEGQSMQRPPLFESDSFIYWKNRFETYVKSKDLDLWHVITNGDFQPIQQNPKTKLDEVIPFEKQSDDLKKRLAKNNEAKMVIYNALPRKEYERIFMCNTAKEIWKTLLITHQDESIDSAFARFNTIITSLKALDEGYSSKNYVRKFLRALHPKWRAKVTAIEESKDLTSLSLDELIGNLKVHEMIIKKDSEIVKAKVKRKSLALKAKKESSDEECSTSRRKDESTPWRMRETESSYLENVKTPTTRKTKSFVRGSWSDSGEEDDEKVKNETCLVAQASSEIFLGVNLEPDEWIKDSGCSKHMTGNRKLFSSYKAYNEGNVIFGSNLRGQICDNKFRVTFSEHDSEITKDGKVIGKTPYELLRGRKPTLDYFRVFGSKCFILNTKDYLTKFDPKSYECVFLGYSQNSKAYIILNKHTRKVEESLNVTFDETPPPSKISPLVDDDLDEEEAVKVTEKKNLENDIEDETLEIDEIVNIKESRNHPLENIIGNLNQRTLRSQNQFHLNYSDECQMFIEFGIQNQFFSYSLKEFAQILDIPYEGACDFTDKWSLDELAYGVLADGPYQTNHPSPNDIISSIQIDQEGQVRRIRYEEEIDVHEYQILIREIVPTFKP